MRVDRGDAFSVRVDIESNILPLVQTRVDGSTLVIDPFEAVGSLLPGPHVTVTMPHLEAASLSGSGRLAVSSIAESGSVTLSESGSGDLDFQGAVGAVSVRLSGSGDVTLGGSTDDIALAVDGSIDARGMPASAGLVDLDGSGNVMATIDGPVNVTLSGSGNVDLFGQVTLAQLSNSGSGRVDVHRWLLFSLAGRLRGEAPGRTRGSRRRSPRCGSWTRASPEEVLRRAVFDRRPGSDVVTPPHAANGDTPRAERRSVANWSAREVRLMTAKASTAGDRSSPATGRTSSCEISLSRT